MSSTTRCMLRLAVLTLVVAALCAAPRGAHAQGTTTGPGNPTVLQAVQALQNQISALQTSVTTLTSSLSTNTTTITTTITNEITDVQSQLDNVSAPGQASVRFTPPIFLDDNQGLLCGVANVDGVAHKVKLELIQGFNGHVLSTFLSGNFALEPGEASGGSRGLISRDFYYCKATVLDGSRTAIRASASSLATVGGILETLTAE